MRLKLLVKAVEKLLGERQAEGLDMYMPSRLLAIAIVMLAGGTAFAVAWFLSKTPWMLAVALGGVAFGVAAILCWKNQKIVMISDAEFEHTTMFGNTTRYAFRDITGLRKNQDSLSLFVAGKKVHIESMAVISDRLAERINRELEAKVTH